MMMMMMIFLLFLVTIVRVEGGKKLNFLRDVEIEGNGLCDVFCPCDTPTPTPPAPKTKPIDPSGPFPARMKIETLPGLATTEPYEYYSGFLNAGTPPSGRGTMYFHYICAMAPDWKNKPMTIWYNGGPGAPSTYGLFQEFGPFLLTEESLRGDDELPVPIRNPWTWANSSSLCEIDSPAPMGASFCS